MPGLKEIINIKELLSELDRMEFVAEHENEKLTLFIIRRLIVSQRDEIASLEKVIDKMEVKVKNLTEKSRVLESENGIITRELKKLTEQK